MKSFVTKTQQKISQNFTKAPEVGPNNGKLRCVKFIKQQRKEFSDDFGHERFHNNFHTAGKQNKNPEWSLSMRGCWTLYKHNED